MDLNSIKNIGIVGVGVMGPGIAEILAIFGSSFDFSIKLFDISSEAIENAQKRMEEDFTKVESVGIFSSDDLKVARDRIQFVSELNDLSESQLIIEVIPEKIELKQKFFKEIEGIVSSDTILATNSSGLSISEIAKVTQNPERVIGTHFMNPPLLMPLVEIVKGAQTSDETIAVITDLLTNVNKRPVLVKKDIPGYVHNRLQAAVFRELMYLVDNEVMDVNDLETTVRYGLGLRLPVMKVFEMVDLMGIDTIKNVLSYLYPALDRSIQPPEFLEKMIKEETLGVKSGKGFHDYTTKDMTESMREKEAATFQLLMMMQQYD